MTTTHLDLPRAIDAKAGDHFQIVLDCVAAEDGLVVEEMAVRNASPDSRSKPDKAAAVAAYLKRWGGALAPLTNEEVDDLRYEAIMEKHSQHLK